MLSKVFRAAAPLSKPHLARAISLSAARGQGETGLIQMVEVNYSS